jgi:hypothetical protein
LVKVAREKVNSLVTNVDETLHAPVHELARTDINKSQDHVASTSCLSSSRLEVLSAQLAYLRPVSSPENTVVVIAQKYHKELAVLGEGHRWLIVLI